MISLYVTVLLHLPCPGGRSVVAEREKRANRKKVLFPGMAGGTQPIQKARQTSNPLIFHVS